MGPVQACTRRMCRPTGGLSCMLTLAEPVDSTLGRSRGRTPAKRRTASWFALRQGTSSLFAARAGVWSCACVPPPSSTVPHTPPMCLRCGQDVHAPSGGIAPKPIGIRRPMPPWCGVCVGWGAVGGTLREGWTGQQGMGEGGGTALARGLCAQPKKPNPPK